MVLENRQLSLLLQQFASSNESTQVPPQESFTNILRQLVLNAEKNHNKCPTHRRHSAILKKFATVLFILAGPMAYELIQQNMPEALPSIRTIQSTIYLEYKTISEGSFRFDELKGHLDQYDAPSFISIAEDATRIVGRVEYDSKTDRCVGFVLPLDQNGLPKGDSFLAVSFSAIEAMFQNNPIAKFAYVYMAQALCSDVPPFCLACIGTDNKFTAMNVMQRWKYIVTECDKRNIAVLSFGGDGDSRVMKGMKVSSSFNTSPSDLASDPLLTHIPSTSLLDSFIIPDGWADWFYTTRNAISFVQDIVHVAVKLKSRLLKPQIVLPMGNFFASSNHLHALRSTFQKDKHGLRLKDVNHKDKQNFQAVVNITNAGDLLLHIPQSSGTKCYISLIKCVIDSYLDKALVPLERIEKLWYVVFVLRYWRKWILLNNHYTLGQNFITSNAYCGVELNAHAMVNFLRSVRDCVNNDSCFVPWLLGSQTCETTFRAARSMSSVYSTVINFGMLGLLRRLHRLHIQLALQAETKEEIVFPGVLKHKQKQGKNIFKDYVLADVTDDEIYQMIKKAQGRAKLMVEELGMAVVFVKHLLWGPDVKIRGIDGGAEYCNELNNDESDSDELSDDDKPIVADKEISCNKVGKEQSEQDCVAQLQETCIEDAAVLANDLENISKHDLLHNSMLEKLKVTQESFKRLSSSGMPIYERIETQDKKGRKQDQKSFNPFVEVHMRDGQSIFIRKTTAVWLLQEGERVSTDRLFRVRNKQPYSIDIYASTTSTSTSTTSTSTSTTSTSTSTTSTNTSTTNTSTTSACNIGATTTEITTKLYPVIPSSVLSNNQFKRSECSESTSEATVTVDLTSREEIDGDDIEDYWVKVERITLYQSDRHIILSGEWLWGTHLTAVQQLLKKQHPNINGLRDTLLIMQEGNIISAGSIQILHVNNNHWITLSTLQSPNYDYDVMVFDSLNSHLSAGVKMQLSKLIKTSNKSLQIKIANVNKQANYDDCGVFAAAYCTALANGQNPSSFVYDQSAMRKHLVQCLSNAIMEPFPVIRDRRSGNARIDTIDVYCSCRSPDDGSPMVRCDRCKEWFHQSCISTKIVKEQRWYCTKCCAAM